MKEKKIIIAFAALFTFLSCGKDEDLGIFGSLKKKYVPTKYINLPLQYLDVWTKHDTISIGDTLHFRFVMPQILKDPYLNREVKINNISIFVKLDAYFETNPDTTFTFKTNLSLYKDLYKYWKTIVVSGWQFDVHTFTAYPASNNFISEVKYVAIKPGKYYLTVKGNGYVAQYHNIDTILNFNPEFRGPIDIRPVNSYKYYFNTNDLLSEFYKKTYFLIYVKE